MRTHAHTHTQVNLKLYILLYFLILVIIRIKKIKYRGTTRVYRQQSTIGRKSEMDWIVRVKVWFTILIVAMIYIHKKAHYDLDHNALLHTKTYFLENSTPTKY